MLVNQIWHMGYCSATLKTNMAFANEGLEPVVSNCAGYKAFQGAPFLQVLILSCTPI